MYKKFAKANDKQKCFGKFNRDIKEPIFKKFPKKCLKFSEISKILYKL